MKVKSQAGFSAVEGLLLLVLVVAIAGIGYYVWHANKTSLAPASTNNTTKQAYTSPPVTTASAPTITNKTQLDSAYQLLNQTSIYSNNTDSNQLSVQSNGL